MTEPALFADLPVQHPPAVIETDLHELMPCRRCDGTGRERCPYPRHFDVAMRWDPTCRGCDGAGVRLLRKMAWYRR